MTQTAVEAGVSPAKNCSSVAVRRSTRDLVAGAVTTTCAFTCRSYTDSNSSAVVFKFGVRLDKLSISTQQS
jgi:hypothetical protein